MLMNWLTDSEGFCVFSGAVWRGCEGSLFAHLLYPRTYAAAVTVENLVDAILKKSMPSQSLGYF